MSMQCIQKLCLRKAKKGVLKDTVTQFKKKKKFSEAFLFFAVLFVVCLGVFLVLFLSCFVFREVLFHPRNRNGKRMIGNFFLAIKR